MTQLPPPDNLDPSVTVCDQCQTPTCLELVNSGGSSGSTSPPPVSGSGVPGPNGSAPPAPGPRRFPEELVARYTPRVRGLIRRVAPELSFTQGRGKTWDGATGEDLEQDVWGHVTRVFSTWPGSSPLCKWVALVARYRIIDRRREYVRKKAGGRLLQEENHQDLPDKNPGDDLGQRSQVIHDEDVQELLRKLNDPDLTLYFLLRYYYQLPLNTILGKFAPELNWTEHKIRKIHKSLLEAVKKAANRLDCI